MKVLTKKKSSVLTGQKPLKKGAQGRSSWFWVLFRAILTVAALWIFAVFLKGFAAPRLAQWLPSIFDKGHLEFVLEAKNLSEKRKNEIHEILQKTILHGSRYEMDQAKNALVSLMPIEKLTLARTKTNRIDVKILARIPFVKISEIDHAWATKDGVVFINHDVGQFEVRDLPVLIGAVQPRTGEEVKKEAELPVSSTEMHAISQALNLLNLLRSADHGAEKVNVKSVVKETDQQLTEITEKHNGAVLSEKNEKIIDEEASKTSSLQELIVSSPRIERVIEIHWNVYRGISFTTLDNTEIVIGQGPFENKLKTLYKLFADGRNKEFSHIELDYRGKIFAKKRG